MSLLRSFRLEIIKLLKNHPKTLSELTIITGKSKQVLLFHLKTLVDKGLVRKITIDKQTHYQATELGTIIHEHIASLINGEKPKIFTALVQLLRGQVTKSNVITVVAFAMASGANIDVLVFKEV